jgi:hypothetical protein
MRKIQPISISSGGFNTCKYSVAVILIAAILLPQYRITLVALSTVILTLSALLGVEKAPMILLFDWSLGRIFKTKSVMLDRKGMRFAHSLGAVLNAVTLLFLILFPTVGFVLLMLTAALKTVSAVGYCSGLKLYQCMNNDTCCSTSKSVLKLVKSK